MIQKLAYIVLIAMLTGCASAYNTTVQGDYEGDKDVCQEQAEQQIHYYAPPPGSDRRDFNAQLVSLFSDCMFSRGWTVATPQHERKGPQK